MSDEKAVQTISEEKQIEPRNVNAEALISQAIDKGLPIDTMERLLAMRRELKEEQAKEAFFRSLSEFQAECPEIPKTKKVMNKDGKTVRYSYAPLDVIVAHVKDLLRHHGFSYTIKTEQDEDNVTAFCHLHHVEGHTETSRLGVPIDKGGYMSAPQKVASALTYAKRYAFCDATGIMTSDEDNDANVDEKPEQKEEEIPQENADYGLKINEQINKAVHETLISKQEGKTWKNDLKAAVKNMDALKRLEKRITDRVENIKAKQKDLDETADKAFQGPEEGQMQIGLDKQMDIF
jgi:hypothetical protein